MKHDFYIGYLNKLPKHTGKTIKFTILLLVLVFILSGVSIALHHQKISNSQFELGKLSTIEGYFFSKPVPLIKILEGKDIYGNLIFKSIPLVNYAKFGSEELIKIYEEKHKQLLNGKKIKIVGTFLYDDGKALLNLPKEMLPFLKSAKFMIPNLKR